MGFKDRDFTENVIYQKLFHDKLATNLGYMYENVVAQTLRAQGDGLFYHTFPSETSNYYTLKVCKDQLRDLYFAKKL